MERLVYEGERHGEAVVYRTNREQCVLDFFERRREERERTRGLVRERSDDPRRGAQSRADGHDRGAAPERGGYDFGR